MFGAGVLFVIKIVFAGGKKLEIPQPLAVSEIIKIMDSSNSSKSIDLVVAAKVNGVLVDLSLVVNEDAEIFPLTVQDPEGLVVLRHSAAHLLAQAVTELFPGVQVTVGPAIEDGFYHDFYYPPGFSENDLPQIEKKMHELVKANYPIVRSVKSRSEALDYFKQRNEQYKVMMVEDLDAEEISFYSQGNFTNLCRGPHVPNTGCLGAFKLTKLAGAYWKGDSHNEMLQRIYGTVWPSKNELDKYLERLERAKQCDHRLLGKKLDLFHLQEEAPGMVFWHPKGWTTYSQLKKYLSNKFLKFGYDEVCTPKIIDKSLWEKSGHWEKYREVMFTTEAESKTYAIKPMNCPGHIQIYNQGIKSYRDLPLRYAELGCCHRNEVSGALHGLMRVREFVQDDGHIFCTEKQMAGEAKRYLDQVLSVYRDFGFGEVAIKLSTRPDQRIGSDEAWDKSEQALKEVLNASGLDWQLSIGEGAFYGPKIELVLRDSLGRNWQCGTLQVDFFMPERLGSCYIDEDGEKKSPIMLHRAMLGSLERFIGILIEERGGDLPLWLAPIQVAIVNITSQQEAYATEIADKLRDQGIRVISDLRNEKMGFKIREHTMQKIPFILIVGEQEMRQCLVSVRTLAGENLGIMPLEKFLDEKINPKLII